MKIVPSTYENLKDISHQVIQASNEGKFQASGNGMGAAVFAAYFARLQRFAAETVAGCGDSD